MRTLCNAYYEEHESHYRAFLDISVLIIVIVLLYKDRYYDKT